MEQKQPLQQMVLGDLDSYVQKNETQSPAYIIHKNILILKAIRQYKKRLRVSQYTSLIVTFPHWCSFLKGFPCDVSCL